MIMRRSGISFMTLMQDNGEKHMFWATAIQELEIRIKTITIYLRKV